MKKSRRIELDEGDVFEFDLPDARFGYGIIIKRGVLKNGGTPYVAIFRSAYDRRPDFFQLLNDEVALAGWTMDTFVYHGRWNVIAHDVPLPNIPFPNFKVEMTEKIYVTDVDGELLGEATAAEQALLDYKFSRAPAGFQLAIEATHGVGEWQDHFDKLTPAYAAARITRY